MGIQVALMFAGAAAGFATVDGRWVQTDEQGQQAVAPSAVTGSAPAPGGVAGDAAWTAIGPFGGDADDVAASPADPNIVLAGIAPSSGSGGGLYRSIDGGGTYIHKAELDGDSQVNDPHINASELWVVECIPYEALLKSLDSTGGSDPTPRRVRRPCWSLEGAGCRRPSSLGASRSTSPAPSTARAGR